MERPFDRTALGVALSASAVMAISSWHGSDLHGLRRITAVATATGVTFVTACIVFHLGRDAVP